MTQKFRVGVVITISAMPYKNLGTPLLCLLVCLSVCLSVCCCLLSVCLFFCLCLCLPVCLSVCPFVCLSVSLFVHLFVCLFVCVSICCLSFCLPVHLSVCLSVCLLAFLSSSLHLLVFHFPFKTNVRSLYHSDQTDNGTGEDIFVTPPASPVPRDRSLSYSPSPSPLRLNSEDPTTQDQKDRPYSFSPGTFPIRFTTDNPTSQGSRDDETLYEEINVTAVKQTASEVDNVYYETTVDLVEKGRSTDGSDVKTEAIEEQIYSVPDDPEQSDVAHDPTGGD